MAHITLDFETYYVAGTPARGGYSLRHMTPVEYILDPRFEVIGCAVIDARLWPQPSELALDFPEPKPKFLTGPEFESYARWLKFRQRDGEYMVISSHNALFDMSILAWRYGVVPDRMLDTLGMARSMIYAFTGDASLKACAEYFGLTSKGNTVSKVSGMNAEAIHANGLWDEYVAYASHDAALCRRLVDRFMALGFPIHEIAVVDLVLRCAVQPKFKLNVDLLVQHAVQIEQEKQQLLNRAGLVDRASLMSNDKFADALRGLGIEPPTKISPTTGEITYAFAKSDPAMVELASHDSLAVQALVAARTGHKSTIEQTRTEKLGRIAHLEWPNGRGSGWSPIALRYSGAHTHRLSGDWKLNAQNWQKKTFVGGQEGVGLLRRAHEAPPGHLVVKCDASQIEARIVAWLAGQSDLVGAFREGKDIYSEFAQENIYHYPVNRGTVDERFIGKGAILGLGFGLGHKKFKEQMAAKSYVEMGRTIILPEEDARMIVQAYRNRYREIPKAWRTLDSLLIESLVRGAPNGFGPCDFEKEAIVLPNKHKLFYPDLRCEDGEWVCTYAKRKKKIYGAKLFENIVQALARIITMNAAVELQSIYPLAHQVHDDLVYVVPEEYAISFARTLEHIMSHTKGWYEGLPLAAEAGVGPNYGDAKPLH